MRRIAVGSATNLTLFRVSDGTPLLTAPVPAPLSIAFSPNGQLIAVAGTGEIKLINASDGSEAGALTGVIGDVKSVAFSPDGRFLLSAGTEVVAWRVGAGGPGFVRAEVPDVTVGRTRDFVLDASASTSSGTIVSYEWDLDNDGDFDDATGAQVHHHFDRLGNFIVRVQVTDNAGRVASDSALVTVKPNVDLVVASLAIEPSSGLSDGAPITLKAVVRNDGPDSLTLPFTVQFEAGGRVVERHGVRSLLAGAETEVAVATKARGGTRQFKVVADPDNAVTEIAEDNNAQTLDVAAIPAPDLSLTNLTISPDTNLSDGQQAQVAATVANTGISTTSNFDVAVFVDGGLFASRTVNGMATGQSQVITIPLKVHVSQRVVKVVVDGGDKVGESNEDTNVRELNLPDIPPPDLTVTELKTVPASGIGLGQKVTLQATIRNAGATTLTPFRVDFTLAGKPYTQQVAGLAGGQSQTVEVVVTAEAGEQNLQVIVDPMRVVLESNENNNSAQLNFGVAVPDLQLTKLTLRPEAGFTSGDTISVAATIQLNGSGRLIAPVAVRLFDNANSIGGRTLDAGLTAGQTVTLGFSWRATPGAHTLRVVADPDNKLPEPDENNNASSLPLPDVPFPDLAVSANLNPPDVGLGFPFFVEGQVMNEGAMTHQPFTVKAEVLNQDNVVILRAAKNLPNGLGANGTADFRLRLVRSKEAKTVRVSVTFDGNAPDANPGNDRVDLSLSDAPLPDYALTGIEATPPDNPTYGQPIAFRASVTNNGASILLQGGVVAIAFFVNDRRVGTGTISSLGNGASATATAKWVIDQPLNNPTIRAAILPDIPDADNANNEAQSTLNLVVAPIDLIPVGVRITPDNVMAGGQSSCRATFRKIAGPDYVGSVAVRALVDGVDLGERAALVRLTDDSPEATIALDWTVTTGNARAVRLIVDPRNALAESDENNNTLDANVDYAVAAPDFVVDSVSYDPQTDVKQGDAVHVTVGIKNAGAGAWGLSVPVRVRLNTGFERVLNVNGFAAGETKTFTFDWTAAPGSNNLLLVQIDPDQRVPESNESNNALNQRLPFTVAPRATLQLSLAAPPPINAPGDSIALNWSLSSSQGEEKVTMSLTAPGLPDGAATVEPASGILAVNGRLSGQVRIVLPSNLGQTQDIPLTLQAQVGSSRDGDGAVTAQQNLRVEAVPVISDLRPLNEARLGANSTVFSWRTQIVSSSEVFIKRPVDSDYQRFAGERGTLHTVRVTDLRPNSTYLFYVRSAGSGGEARSEERRIFVSRAIAFTQSAYVAEVRRDYDQRLSVRIVNTDSRAHDVKVELVDNPYPDAVAGLIGEGTVDEPATLLAGQALTVTFAGHFQDAQNTDYAFRIRVRTVGESAENGVSEEMSDDAIVKMRVH